MGKYAVKLGISVCYINFGGSKFMQRTLLIDQCSFAAPVQVAHPSLISKAVMTGTS
jgi:hypothetical protein